MKPFTLSLQIILLAHLVWFSGRADAIDSFSGSSKHDRNRDYTSNEPSNGTIPEDDAYTSGFDIPLGKSTVALLSSVYTRNRDLSAVEPSFLSSSSTGLYNVALGKEATQSSTYCCPTATPACCSKGAASKAVDGNTDPYYKRASVTRTKWKESSWWKVDLGGLFLIEQIKVYQRLDANYAKKDRQFELTIFNNGEVVKKNIVIQPNVTDIIFNEDVIGDTVKIDAIGNIKQTLCLAEVEVFSRGGPIDHPSSSPSISFIPTPSPSMQPSKSHEPSTGPTQEPTSYPSTGPTQEPTSYPSSSFEPSSRPSSSNSPSTSPSSDPTQAPTVSTSPSTEPSSQPSLVPSNDPSAQPSSFPTQTMTPSAGPSEVPSSPPTHSMMPTTIPSTLPSSFPTQDPTLSPSSSIEPSSFPSEMPTLIPSQSPTESLEPTTQPTLQPSKSVSPTAPPTSVPSPDPTVVPSMEPTIFSSSSPSKSPFTMPSSLPSKDPTLGPTKNPTPEPTKSPTSEPTKNPTSKPTSGPTKNPTSQPTKNPTPGPTAHPTPLPTPQASSKPTQPLYNIALGKDATQSSLDCCPTGESSCCGSASKAVDGNTDAFWEDASVTSTMKGLNAPWWKVDLGGLFAIEKINVYKRLDPGFLDKRKSFNVTVLSEGRIVSTYITPGIVPQNVTEIVFDEVVVGDEVEVSFLGPGKAILSLAEVEVYSAGDRLEYPSASPTESPTSEYLEFLLIYLFL